MNQPTDALAERAIREHWEFLPTSGSRIGRNKMTDSRRISPLGECGGRQGEAGRKGRRDRIAKLLGC